MSTKKQSSTSSLEFGIKGMDCADCVAHVRKSLSKIDGVIDADVFLASEKAVIKIDPDEFKISSARKAVTDAGYSFSEVYSDELTDNQPSSYDRAIKRLTALVFVVVLVSVVLGEWMGMFDWLADIVPGFLGIAVVLLAGFPIFKKVILASIRFQVISQTLMSLGVVAALVAGQWVTALIVVFFMRIGDFIESYTTDKMRDAIRKLSGMKPKMARVIRTGQEQEVPLKSVEPGDLVVVRPGESVPVDGRVVSGHASIDQSAITGESSLVDVGPGAAVYAATLAHGGSIQVVTDQTGPETTFGRILTMVEEAEANRSEFQSFADKFSAYFLPVVLAIAVFTWFLQSEPMAVVAVLVVACSCAIALATPIAMMASIGSGARNGLMIKGGKYIELMEKSDVLLIDKTGTLTLGKPILSEIVSLNNVDESHLLWIVASVERYSDHPFARAVRQEAAEQKLSLGEPKGFSSHPGLGVQATVSDKLIRIGNFRWLEIDERDINGKGITRGKSLLFVEIDGEIEGYITFSDKLRSTVPEALATIKKMGLSHIELLTGDNELVAAELAAELEIEYRANLLPQDKIDIVKSYQREGHRVVMIGDGINDAPALAQADVGIAMSSSGTDVALELAHIVLMRDDWNLVPKIFQISQRTMRVVRMNLLFTALYNGIGLTLAALGILPPVLAAAAQSLPDLGILANSSRLMRE